MSPRLCSALSFRLVQVGQILPIASRDAKFTQNLQEDYLPEPVVYYKVKKIVSEGGGDVCKAVLGETSIYQVPRWVKLYSKFCIPFFSESTRAGLCAHHV